MSAVAPLPDLVHRYRRRLWWLEARERLLFSLPWSGALLLPLALAHRFAMTVPIGIALALAAMPPLVAALRSLAGRRPSLAQAARAADDHFSARSLLLAASEADATDTPRTLAGLLLRERANRAATQWIGQLRTEPLPQTRRPVLFPTVGVLACLLIIQLPGAPASPRAAPAAAAAPESALVGTRPERRAEMLAGIPSEAADDGGFAAPRRAFAEADRDAGGPAGRSARSDHPPDDQGPARLRGPGKREPAAAGGAAGSLAADPDATPSATPDPTLAATYRTIARGGEGAQSSASGRARALQAAPPPAPMAGRPGPVATPPAGPSQPYLTRLERRHVARYFERIAGDRDDR